MAVALGQYKAHFWTWTNSWEEFSQVGRLGAVTLHPYPLSRGGHSGAEKAGRRLLWSGDSHVVLCFPPCVFTCGKNWGHRGVATRMAP